MMTNIQTYTDKSALVQSLAKLFHTIESTSMKERGGFSLALAGGSTPKALYQYLAESEDFHWDKWHIFFGDERTVPPDDEDSNYHMASETLLSKVPIPENQVHRMQGELDPTVAAEAYEQVLKDVFGGDSFPRLDLILLGMGDDGHTASLFPHTAAIHESKKWVVAHYVEKLDTWRITLTPPVLNNARHIIFMVTGDKKADRLNQVLNGDYQPDTLPSQIIKPEHGQLLWYTDQAAASQLG
jgi:6-phosphogluconolactonase